MIYGNQAHGMEPEGQEGQKSHADLVKMVREAFDETMESREEEWTDFRFYHGDQWTLAEKAVLKERGQDPTVAPFVRRKVNFLRGVIRRSIVDPEAYPTSRAHEKKAHIASDVLKYYEERLKIDRVRELAAFDFAARHVAAVEVGAEVRRGRTEPYVAKIKPEEWFYDPLSSSEDFSDAAYLGVLREMDADHAAAVFGQALLEAFYDDGFRFSAITDKRPNMYWGNRDRRRVRVAQIYYRTPNGWRYACFTQTALLKDMTSPYLDNDGEPFHPYIARSLYVDHQNWRYGVVRDMRDPQREYNRRRSRAFFEALARRTYAKAGAVQDVAAFKREITHPNGHVTIAQGAEWGRDVGVIEAGADMSAQMEFIAEAKTLIDLQGPNSALMGRGVENQSGRAIEAQQDSGLTEEDPFIAGMTEWTHALYVALWARCRQFVTDSREIQIIRDDGEREWMAINEPVPATDPMTGQPIVDPMTGQPVPATDPATGAPVIDNALAEIDVEITIALVADAINSEERERARLLEFARSGVPIPPQVVIEVSGLRRKDRILKLMQEQSAPNAPSAAEEAALRKIEAEAMLKEAQAAKTQVETMRAAVVTAAPAVEPTPLGVS